MDVVDILREGVGVALKLGAPLLLLSMLAAYISNQVTISSKRAELDTLNEQIAQQKTVVVLILLAAGGWMLETLKDFTRYLFTLM